MTGKHPCHADEIGKLNRIAGQIAGVKRMIEQRRYCPEILAQLRAARAAMRGVEAAILETHLRHCVREALTGGDRQTVQARLDEIKTLFRRYDEV